MRSLLSVLLLCASLNAHAQSSEGDLKARLLHKPFYLRHSWGNDKLHFDPEGKLLGKAPYVSFTLSGVEFNTFTLRGDALELKGHRVGLEFKQQVPTRVVLQQANGILPGTHDEEIRLVIDRSPTGDYGPALDNILTDRLDDLVPNLPPEWQPYAHRYILKDAPPEEPVYHAAPGTMRIGGGVTPPKVLFAPEPQYAAAARDLRLSGNVLVYLQVNKAGEPVKLHLLRPLGGGLDEQAIVAVRAYRFEPAKENGEPVAVEMNVEVNFQIF